MKKQFEEFRALVPPNFKELMIQYWMRNEVMDRQQAIDAYMDESFDKLNKRIANTVQTFKPDLGYRDNQINGTLCFEVKDDSFVIPVEILEEEEEEEEYEIP
jgi:hypothetical protein